MSARVSADHARHLRRERRLLLGLALVATAYMVGDAWAGLCDGALHLVPFFLLLVPLLAGRYVGERVLERWRRAFAPRRPRPVAALRRRPRPGERRARPVLEGLALASRPPPRCS